LAAEFEGLKTLINRSGNVVGLTGKMRLRFGSKPLLLLLVVVASSSFPLGQSYYSHGFLSAQDFRQGSEFLVSGPLCGGFISGLRESTGGVFGDAYLALGAVGGGDITLVYDSSFPVESRSYAQELFDIVYPEIRLVYGNPSNTITVTLSYEGSLYPWNFYYGPNNTIILSQLPPSSGTSPVWDAVFTHELIHAFHDAVYLLGGSWAEEGMTEAATQIVAMNLKDRMVRDIVYRDPVVNLKYYDAWSFMGSDLLGGGPDFTYKFNPDLSYRTSSAMFFILTAELSTSPSNPYDFLARLNGVIYSDASSNPFFDDLRFKMKIRQAAAGRLVEGQLADVWVGSQPVTSTVVRTGFKLGVYPYRPENPTRTWAITFMRNPDGRETPLGGLQVYVRVVDAGGRTVSTGSLTTGSDGMGAADVAYTTFTAGGYQVVASTIYNGINYTAVNYAFSQGESVVIEQADRNLYGVTLDRSGRPVSGSVSVEGGSIKLNAGGAFKIEAANQTLPCELEVTSGAIERRFGKPNPYTRVVWMNSTAPATTPYTVTVEVAGLPEELLTTLRVDDVAQGVVHGGGSTSLSFDVGTTHTIMVDSYVNASSVERFHCVNNLQTVTSGVVLVFTYLREVYSVFEQSGSARPVSATIDGTNYALPVGFWWVNGSGHTFGYQSNLTDGFTRYLLTGTSVSSPVTVVDPLVVTGFYKTQYFLNVTVVPVGLVALSGSGWYDSGSRVGIEASAVSGYTFRRWLVDRVEVAGNPVEVSMDGPHTAVAEYQSVGVYDVTVTAVYAPTGEGTEAAFTWDGVEYVTPHIFSGVSGSHSLVMSSTDRLGRSLSGWRDLAFNVTSRTISAGGTYTALYGVSARGFTLSASPDQQRIGPGQSTSFTLTLESLNGFSSPVTLGLKGLPANSNSTFNPRTLTPPGTSTLLINTLPGTPVGSYALTVTAVGDGLVRTVNVRLSMGACIVATAAYGSELSPEVQFLRGFRDGTVRRTFAGESFMTVFNLWYYSFSPSVVDFLMGGEVARGLVRVGLYPLIGILRLSSILYAPFGSLPELGVFVSGALASFLIGAVYFSPVFGPLMLRRGRRFRGLAWRLGALIIACSLGFSLLGELCLWSGVMMLGTAAFVIGVIVLSVLASSRLLAFVIGWKRRGGDLRVWLRVWP